MPQFEGINSLAFCLLYGPALTTERDCWEDDSLDYMNLCQQSNVSAFQHTVQVCHSSLAKKQSSYDFMASVVTIHSDFRAQEEEICHYFHLSPSICHEVNIQKMKIMASGPITSQQIEGEKVEAVTDFLSLGSKITADDDCSPEIRRQLLLGRKAMTNLDSVLKSRDITLATKVHIVKAMVFPVVM